MRLKGMGHEVTILTAMPNYPTGKIFDGYRQKVRIVEDMNGLRVIRTCLYPSKSSRFLPRLVSYYSFALSSLLLGIWSVGKQDVVLIETPPLFLVPSGLILAKLTGAKSVMMVSDIIPDLYIRTGLVKRGFSLNLTLALEKFCYDHSDAVALTNPGACDQIKTRFPYLERVTVISNGVDTKMFRSEFRDEKIRESLGAKSEEFLVGYCGLHGLNQGLEVVIQAAEKLRDRSDIKFIMVGDGPTKDILKKMAMDLNLKNITFYDPRPKKEMPAILASIDASLIPLVVRLPGTMPSKIYEALASGTPPIIAKGCEGEALVNRFEVGKCYEPGQGAEIADSILAMADHRDLWNQMKKNCLDLSSRFNRDLIARRTNEVLTAIKDEQLLPNVKW
jgi:glycosyltransferase involved in cell wall biosynthesis